jgi:3-deoxy-D-manno-octulosonate 8-phosphate phosphatase (KDO 8-P phosphatase)
MDVDGVLTDGGILILESGEEVKVWNVRDRIGFFMLRRFGDRFPVAWITGRKSRQVAARAREIGVAALHQRCEDKGRALEETMGRLGLTSEETLYVGDDLVDLPALRRAGLAVCPADAHPAVRRACGWITRAVGGRGAVREVIDGVLDAQGLLDGVVEGFSHPARR